MEIVNVDIIVSMRSKERWKRKRLKGGEKGIERRGLGRFFVEYFKVWMWKGKRFIEKWRKRI